MKRCLLSLIGGVLLLASLFVNIPAATVACENLSPEEQTRLVKQLGFRAVEDKTLLNDGMVTFDVSEKHEIAIGLLNDVILILDKNFQIFRMYQPLRLLLYLLGRRKPVSLLYKRRLSLHNIATRSHQQCAESCSRIE